MPAQTLQTEACVLRHSPAAESFQGFTLFSAEHGLLAVFQRVSKRAAPESPRLDLFDEASVMLESSNQGRTWFVREARILRRAAELGLGYEGLRAASSLASLVARNPLPEESREATAELLRSAFAALARTDRPGVVLFKSFYRFARSEGYPLREQWLPMLDAGLRAEAERLLHTPLADLAGPDRHAVLQSLIEDYLRGQTDIVLPQQG